MKCRTIENKLQSAQMRRENNLNQIKMRLQFDQARKDHLGQQKIKDVEKTLKEEENPKPKKKVVPGQEDEHSLVYESSPLKQIQPSVTPNRPMSAFNAKPPTGLGVSFRQGKLGGSSSVFNLKNQSSTRDGQRSQSGQFDHLLGAYSDNGAGMGKRSTSQA